MYAAVGVLLLTSMLFVLIIVLLTTKRRRVGQSGGEEDARAMHGNTTGGGGGGGGGRSEENFSSPPSDGGVVMQTPHGISPIVVQARGRAVLHQSPHDSSVASTEAIALSNLHHLSVSEEEGETRGQVQGLWRWFSGWRSPAASPHDRTGTGGEVYADNNATTQMFRESAEAVVRAQSLYYANPSSIHAAGKRSADALERSRDTIANLIGARPQEIYFTSGATESNNIAIRGLMRVKVAPAFCALLSEGRGSPRAEDDHDDHDDDNATKTIAKDSGHSERHKNRKARELTVKAAEADRRGRRKRLVRSKIVTTPIEHASVYETVTSVDPGIEVLTVHVDRSGKIDDSHFASLVKDPKVAMACVIMANNEIGTIQDVTRLARVCHRHGVHFHCDMTQVFGKMRVRVDALGVDSATMSAHKFHGPKGVGCLFVKEGIWIDNPCMTGGSQEGAVRAGTENIAGVCGMAVALARCDELLALGRDREVRLMRDNVLRSMQENIPGLVVNGAADNGGLYNTISVCIPGVNSRALIPLMDAVGVYVNTGCACSKGQGSATLRALGLTEKYINGSLRISLSFLTTEEQCRKLCAALYKALDVYAHNVAFVNT